MKKSIPHTLLSLLAVSICLMICLFFGKILFFYTAPMQDESYDLSLSWEGEAMPDDWEYDQKGWTVFTQEQDRVTPLTADQMGGFLGLQRPEQTFYFSRVLTEKLDSPTLRISTANRNFAVFLDDELIYTDCPELDNRIGYLTLPMLDFDRSEPIVLSLPLNYHGKTLTIAQSTGMGDSQGPETDLIVYPCSVSLYCGYSYESSLISESFRTAIPSSICFGIGVLLLAAFLWQLFSGKTDISLPLLALTAFLLSTWHIALSSFTYYYVGVLPFDIVAAARLLSLTLLLAFLTSRLTGLRRMFFSIITVLHGALVLLCAVPDIGKNIPFFQMPLPELIGLLGLIGIYICISRNCISQKRKQESLFTRIFFSLVCVGFVGFLLCMLLFPGFRKEVVQQYSLRAYGYFLWKLMALMLPSAVLAALMEVISQEISRRSEAKLLATQYQLAQSGFENLRRHHEEIMMLRHDMNKHLLFLRKSTTDEAIANYLDELLGQQKKLRPIIQSRNASADLILNAKLGEAAEKNINVEIIQADIPKVLPFSDTELCALLMNLLDNAIQAASAAITPYLRLDLHQKDQFFVFVFENSLSSDKTGKKETAQMHGLGLKIVDEIIKRHGNLMKTEHLPDAYRITIAIPLD